MSLIKFKKNNFKKLLKEASTEYSIVNSIKKSGFSIKEKAEKILKIKNDFNKNILSNEINNNFYIDGAIKIPLNLVNDKILIELKELIYVNGSNLIFRNKKYYNLFDSVEVFGIKKHCSINDVTIESVDIHNYIIEFINFNNIITGLIDKYNDLFNNNTNNKKLYKQLLLGLLDAKINLIAQVLNFLLILGNKNFLNSDFEGELIFSKEDIINIKKNVGNIFTKYLNNIYISGEYIKLFQQDLEYFCGYYTKILINDDLNKYNNIISNNLVGEVLNGPFQEFFKLMDLYVDKYRNNNEIRKNKYYNSRGSLEGYKNLSGYENSIKQRKKAYQKLLRLYREENNQLLMFKAGLNSFYYLMNEKKSKNYELNIVSVSYGGITIGSFVKPILEKLLPNNIVINNKIITYSIYDLKNKGKNLKINDYPFSEIDKIILESRKKISNIIGEDFIKGFKSFDNKVFTIIFDDNSFSGETLYNLQKLFNEKFYFNINLVPCRGNFNLLKYSKKIDKHDLINILSNSGTDLRMTNIGKKSGKKYNELIGVIIGNRLYKENKLLIK